MIKSLIFLEGYIYASKDEKITAKVTVYKKNSYIIKINIGAVHSIYKLVLYLFANHRFMPKIGLSKIEKKQNKLIQGKIYNYIPSCPVRLEYAGNITILSIIIFFYHELAHILRGHLEYSKTIYSINAINDGEEDKTVIDIRKALECDADYYSGYFLGLTYKNERALFKNIFNSNNEVDFFKSCTIAAKLSFHSFEKSFSKKNYHLPKTRLEVFLEGLTVSLNLEDVALENAAGVVFGIERAFDLLKIDLGSTPEMVEKDGQEFYQITSRVWADLEKVLSKFRE